MDERIEINPLVCHGKPVIRGTRIMVTNILSLLAGGYDFAKIRQGYPEISDEDIRAAVAYAASVIQDEEIRFIAPAAWRVVLRLLCEGRPLVTKDKRIQDSGVVETAW